jgi:stage V sporulation protein AB
MIKEIILILIYFSSGLMISTAFAALITQLRLINRLVYHTNTNRFLKLYKSSLILGVIFGGISEIISFNINIIFGVIFFFCIGIFHACLAMLLAEMLNVLPFVFKKINISRYFNFLILFIALGKFFGCLIYYFLFKLK